MLSLELGLGRYPRGYGAPPYPYGGAMVLEFLTTAPGETVTIPAFDTGTFDAVIDWGDASTSEITTWNDADLAHTFAVAGTQRVTISGSFPALYFSSTGDRLKLTSVVNVGRTGLGAFNVFGCTNMTTCEGFSTTDATIQGTLFNSSFRNTTNLSEVVLTGLDISGATAALALFFLSGATLIDVRGLSTGLITTMSLMFASVPYDAVVGADEFDISSCTNFSDFMSGSGISSEKYGALLEAWALQTFATNPTTATISFGTSKYPASAAAARAIVAANFLTFTDGGVAP